MAFIENLERLAFEQGKSLTEITLEVGMASSVISKWKAGSIPRNATLKKIADHFGVTVDYLLADNPPPVTKWDSKKETSEYGTLSSQEKQIIDMYRELTEMGKMRLLSAILRVYDEETSR